MGRERDADVMWRGCGLRLSGYDERIAKRGNRAVIYPSTGRASKWDRSPSLDSIELFLYKA